jgi:radical SAM protein with 4Fe4S-binding SPASM domain
VSVSVSDFPFKPRVVGWELTLRCNMACIHCGSRAGAPRPDELSEAEGLDLIGQMAELGTEVVTLSGGEPLLHPSWHVYASRLRDLGVRTYMITNGLLLEENLPRLLETGLTRVGISVDGTEATHDRIRARRGSFQAVMGAARALRGAGVGVGAVTHVSKANIDELDAMHAVFAALPLDFWQVQITFRQGRMLDHADMALDPEQLPRVAAFVAERQAAGGPVRVVAGDNLGYYADPPIRDLPWKGCFAGRHLMGVDADGAVKGCLSLPREFVEGYVRKESLRTIWEDPERFRYNRYFTPEDLHGSCAGCPKGDPCRAGCVVTAHAATGDRFHNPYCIFGLRRQQA